MRAANGIMPNIHPGVKKNPHGGYPIQIKLNERRASPIVGGGVNPTELAPPDTPILSDMEIFEDCVLFNLPGGQSLLIHASNPEVAGSVVCFYHPNGRLWRVAPLEKLNPGWVLSRYRFRGDLGKFETRLSRMKTRQDSWPRSQQVTFWQTGGWSGAIVGTATGLVYRMKSWQHSALPAPEIERPPTEQVETLSDPRPAAAQQIIALQAEGVAKQTDQVGGLRLILKYLDQVGLIEIVSQYCPRCPKDVRDFVKVTFRPKNKPMTLSYHLRPDTIAQAAQLDGRWMVVTNQPPEQGQAPLDYLDWMVSVYKNHRHIERRMRNLKSDLPIRPLYAHRDEVILPRCFVCVLALMVYTLIERDCQAKPALVEVGLTTPDRLLAALAGHGLTVFETPANDQVFWFDTPTDTQTLIWAQFELANRGASAPMADPTGQ